MCQYGNKNIKQLDKRRKSKECLQLGKSIYFNSPISQGISRRISCPSRQLEGSQGRRKGPLEAEIPPAAWASRG